MVWFYYIGCLDIGAASFLGQTEPTTMPFKPSFYKLSGQELVSTTGDLNRAITILENNGYDKLTSEGYRTDGVNTLMLSILVCNNNPYKKSVATALQKSLETLGIKATITVKNKADYLEALKEGYYEIYIGEIELPADYDLSEFYTAEGQVNYGITEKASVNYVNFQAGRLNMTEFVENFNTDVPFAPLFFRKTVMSVNPQVSGITTNEGDVYLSASDWKVKK